MKKIFWVVVLMLLLCCFSSAVADSAKQYTGGDYVYILLEDGTAEIVDYEGSASSLTVPAKLDNHSVTGIGDYAFAGTKLQRIELPDTIVKVGANPFRSCNMLDAIRVSPDHPALATIDGVLFDKNQKKLISYPVTFSAAEYQVPKGICVIGESAFDHAMVQTVVLQEGITTIEKQAFAWCKSLRNVELPEGLTTIGEQAFSYCEALSNIALPQGLVSMDEEVFVSCYSLAAITLPDSLTEAKGNPFKLCISLTGIGVSADNSRYYVQDEVLFDRIEQKLVSYPCGKTDGEYKVPDGVNVIGDAAFYGCDFLKNLVLPDGLVSIEYEGIASCKSLVSIDLPDTVTDIAEYAFASCSALKDVVISEGITKLNRSVFSMCKALKNVTLPSGINDINSMTFFMCPDNLSFTVARDSWAAQWCQEQGYDYQYHDSLDWLNE